tara:strand:+ start:1183 stop:1461 length:279 start_codon:yes stop_codon:yes gene_type:complete
MFSKFWEMLQWRRVMLNHSEWFDKNEPAQDRFEENEEWLEELEERVDKLEQIAHPAKDIENFESYPQLLETIRKLAREEIGRATAEKVNSEE